MGFPRQEYWSGLPFPSSGIFLIRDWTLIFCTAGRFFTNWATMEALKRIVDNRYKTDARVKNICNASEKVVALTPDPTNSDSHDYAAHIWPLECVCVETQIYTTMFYILWAKTTQLPNLFLVTNISSTPTWLPMVPDVTLHYSYQSAICSSPPHSKSRNKCSMVYFSLLFTI